MDSKVWENSNYGEKNIEIIVNGKKYKLNRNMMNKAEFFRRINNCRYIENDGCILLDRIDNIKTWEKILEYIYEDIDEIKLNKLKIEQIISLYKLADKLIIDNLIIKTEIIIKKHIDKYYNMNDFRKCENILNKLYPNLDYKYFNELCCEKITYNFKTRKIDDELNIVIKYPLIFYMKMINISINRNDIHYNFDKIITFKYLLYNIYSHDLLYKLCLDIELPSHIKNDISVNHYKFFPFDCDVKEDFQYDNSNYSKYIYLINNLSNYCFSVLIFDFISKYENICLYLFNNIRITNDDIIHYYLNSYFNRPNPEIKYCL